MNRFCILLLMSAFCLSANAQTAPYTGPTIMPYGKVDMADLEMKSCDFEPNANAEVLFDKASVSWGGGLIYTRHQRIKIFTEQGKSQANFKLQYISYNDFDKITSIEAETINLNNGEPQFFKLDKKDFYTQKTDIATKTIAFSFPNVQPGSIIEVKYTLYGLFVDSFPDWYFQSTIPTRYSEFKNSLPETYYFKRLEKVDQSYVINTDNDKALANIPSFTDEPFMGARKDNLQHINFQLASVLNSRQELTEFGNTWDQIAKEEARNPNFGQQAIHHLAHEGEILDKAKAIKDTTQKMIFLFNQVKNTMKWNETDEAYTRVGTQEAWNKKIGNSTEINLILYHLLDRAGIKVFPMKVSTRENGKVYPGFPSVFAFNKTVVYKPGADGFCLLDATGKYNEYNTIPANLLNSMGFYVDLDAEKGDVTFLSYTPPVRKMVSINAEIKPNGEMNGTAHINSYGYNRISAIEKYKAIGDKKFMEYLQDGDNTLNVSSLKFENMDVDSLPLLQVVDFKHTLAGTDGDYIYFSPNLFTGLHTNEFLNNSRHTDIDFGYNNAYVINGVYKLPAGYKVDALPKSKSMNMPDNSITFKRITAEEDGMVSLRFTIVFKKSVFFKENYISFHDFFKKMHEMLDEQVVLKKI